MQRKKNFTIFHCTPLLPPSAVQCVLHRPVLVSCSRNKHIIRCDQNGPPARRDEGAYLNGYVTEEQRSRRPISSQPSGLRVFWPAALSLIGRRPQRVFSLFASRIQPKYAAAPLNQSRTWCTSRFFFAFPRIPLRSTPGFHEARLRRLRASHRYLLRVSRSAYPKQLLALRGRFSQVRRRGWANGAPL